METRFLFGLGMCTVALGNLLIGVGQFRIGEPMLAVVGVASAAFVGGLGVMAFSERWQVVDDAAVSSRIVRIASVIGVLVGGVLTLVGGLFIAATFS